MGLAGIPKGNCHGIQSSVFMRRTYEEIVVAALVIDFNKGGGVSSNQLSLNEVIAIELI